MTASVRPPAPPHPGSTGRVVALTTQGSLRLASVPADHVYPRHLLPRDASDRVVLLPDPDPDQPSRPASGRWWPPVLLEPEHLDGVDADVLHVHFGFDDRTPADLARLLEAAALRRLPVVLTVHDLRSPHQEDSRRLDAQLDVLVPGVSAVLTLTAYAAGEIRRRWGRDAVVVPHPHVVGLTTMTTIRAARRLAPPRELVVGLAVKSLRVNTDPLRLLPALEQATARRTEARVRVTVHHDVRRRTDARARAVVAGLAAARQRGVEVVWHDPWSDAELWRELAGLHVAVLPYRFGTHSGWLEACHDLGTRVLAPGFGGYADQGADACYDADERSVDEDSLVGSLVGLLDQDPAVLAGQDADGRARQRDELATAHLALYERVLGRAGHGVAS